MMNDRTEEDLLDKEPFPEINTLSPIEDVFSTGVSGPHHDLFVRLLEGLSYLRPSRRAKVAFDVSAAIVGLIIVAPIFLIMAIVVKCDGGPVFFGHTRIGEGGRTFRCLKLRTMVVDSEAVLQDLLERDPAAAEEWSTTRKLMNDPRITWFGRILRRTSLDELPQLLNVARLEMSLVGPRPIVNEEIPRYGDAITDYFKVKPGLTGLWQVGGRNGTSYAKRVELDRRYVTDWTLWLDFVILLRTIPAVLRRDGAF